MPHPFTSNLKVRDLNTAAIADYTLIPDGLKLAAITLPLLGGSKNFLAEQTIPLRSK
jgi:hypothetical protein